MCFISEFSGTYVGVGVRPRTVCTSVSNHATRDKFWQPILAFMKPPSDMSLSI